LSGKLPCAAVGLLLEDNLSAVVITGSVLVKNEINAVREAVRKDPLLGGMTMSEASVSIGAGPNKCATSIADGLVLLVDPGTAKAQKREFAEISDKTDGLRSGKDCPVIGAQLEAAPSFRALLAGEASRSVQFWLHEPGLSGEIACRRQEGNPVRWRPEWVRR